MGLKWFRARLTMNRAPKRSTITSVAGFYRSMSQFDNDIQLPQSTSFARENNTAPSIHSVPTSPEPIAFNPMAGLNNREIKTSEVPRDIVSSPRTQWEIGNGSQKASLNKELESPDEGVPRHLPRESIELMRDISAEASPHRVGSSSRKIDFKRKKARAPLPKMANSSSAEGGEKFIMIDKGRGSDDSEIEI